MDVFRRGLFEMKYCLRSLILYVALISLVHAYVGFDVCNYGEEKLDSVLCYGPSVFAGTVINGHVKVAGSLNAKHVKLGTVNIIGTVEINDAVINGDTEITGSLNANKTSFDKNIKLTATYAQFKASTVKGAIIMYSGKNKPIITVVCGTKILGSVTFANESGVVRMSPDSIIEGKLVNGTIETIKFDCQAIPR